MALVFGLLSVITYQSVSAADIISSTKEINDSTANGPFLSNNDEFGSSIANIGDLNNDGIPDIAVGAKNDDAGGSNYGTIHIMFMNRDGTVDSTKEINDSTANGPNLAKNDYFGVSVADIGDLNNDGIRDIVVGASHDDNSGSNRGAIHIMFMNRDGTVDSTKVINDGTANGPVLATHDHFGASVAGIGDLDNDGIPDIAAGTPSNLNTNSRGAIHIMFMNRDGTVDSTKKINDGTANGPTLANYDQFGASVASIGDLNNDGIPDIVSGAPDDDAGGTARGAIHIMFMKRDGTVSSTKEINGDTANGPTVNTSDYFGQSVVNIGDLNGDGISDIVVGAYGDNTSGAGAVHIIFMKRDGTVSNTREINNNTPNGPSLSYDDYFGYSVAGIGDLDNDGVLDIVSGAPDDDDSGSTRGAIHIMFMNNIDTVPPVITSITSDATSLGALKVGDSITFTLTLSSTETGATINGAFNSQSLIWSRDNNGVTYTATYVISEGDADQTSPIQITGVTITDDSGNTSVQKDGTDILKTIDANTPVITSITSDATSLGALKVGDSITFTLTLSSTETGATINGAFNSQSLIWSRDNNGVTYTATSVISEGDADQTSPIQITGVTITDDSGNTSVQKDGTDILKTIDANTPVITSITSNATSSNATSSGALKVGDSITFTLTLSSTETGATINGAFNSQSLIWSRDNNGVTYTATYVISEGGADQTAPLQITNVTITDVSGNKSVQKDGTDILKTIDANTPTIDTISSNATSFGVLKVNDSITFTLTLNSTETGATINGTFNSQSLIWSRDNNGATYTATYVISEGDADQTAPPQITNVTITDVSGNKSVQKDGTDILKTIDANSPTITLTGSNSQTIELGNEYTELGATTSDGSQVIIDATELIDEIGTYSIYYDSTDTSGNNAIQVIRTVIISDTIPPIITLTGANPQILELDNGYTELGATTNDGSPVTINSDEFTGIAGTYSIYYDSMDTSGNNATQVIRTVIISDTIPPIITLTGANSQTIELGNEYTELGATTSDGSQVIIDATELIDEIGTYSIYYDSMDTSGNNAIQVIRTVIIVDTTPPLITLTGANPQTIILGNEYTELGATTSDGSQVIIDATELIDEIGTYSIYYDSTDASGNNAIQVIRTVEVIPLPTSCTPPASGDWIVNSSCTINSNTTAQGNVIVQNDSVLSIPSGVTLDIDFASFSLTVQSGSGVFIKSGGTIT